MALSVVFIKTNLLLRFCERVAKLLAHFFGKLLLRLDRWWAPNENIANVFNDISRLVIKEDGVDF
jgi:hypothetical protein